MIEVDGSAGGGQILRSSLALAGVTGEAVRVENVRGDRDDPGLKHQHRACVAAAAAVCDADVDGDELGSETVVFEPDEPTGGEVSVDVGTAGAVTLVFETVLPFAVALDEPLSVTATGGTDVAWSPTLAYYRRVRLPLARRFGWRAHVERGRRGFYPAGGGRATLHVSPSTPQPAEFFERGTFEGAHVNALASEALADADVATRMADAAATTLRDAGLDVSETNVRVVDAPSTGASALVVLDYDSTVAGFSALGEPGRPAEDVGGAAATDAVAFHHRDDSPAGTNRPPVVDAHAADQLVLPLALAGGRVVPADVTGHVETNCAVARAFGFDVRVDDGVLRAAGD